MVTKEIIREIIKCYQLNGNKNTRYQNLWDTANIEFRGVYMALNVFLRGKIKNKLSKKLESEEQNWNLISKWKEITKIQAKIHVIEYGK